MSDRDRDRAEMDRARQAVLRGTATPSQMDAVADDESKKAGAKARQRTDARDFLTTLAAMRRCGLHESADRAASEVICEESGETAEERAIAIVAAAEKPRRVTINVRDADGRIIGEREEWRAPRTALAARDTGRMSVDALSALAFRAAVRAVATERRHGWQLSADRVQDVTADVAADLVLATLAATSDERSARALAIAFLVAPHGPQMDAAERAIGRYLNGAASRLPLWTDAPPSDGDDDASTFERWTRALIRGAGPIVTATRNVERHGHDLESAAAAADRCARLTEIAPDLARMVDRAADAPDEPMSGPERSFLISRVDERRCEDRAADAGRTAGAERVRVTRGAVALAARGLDTDEARRDWTPTGDAAAILDAIDEHGAAAERHVWATIVDAATSIGHPASTARRAAQQADREGCEERTADRLAELASERRSPDPDYLRASLTQAAAPRHGRPADVLAYIGAAVAHDERCELLTAAATERACQLALIESDGVPTDPTAAARALRALATTAARWCVREGTGKAHAAAATLVRLADEHDAWQAHRTGGRSAVELAALDALTAPVRRTGPVLPEDRYPRSGARGSDAARARLLATMARDDAQTTTLPPAGRPPALSARW